MRAGRGTFGIAGAGAPGEFFGGADRVKVPPRVRGAYGWATVAAGAVS